MTDIDPTSDGHPFATPADLTLAESEAQLRALVAASSDVIYRMSPDWTEMRQLDGRGFLADAKAPTVRWWDEYIYPEDRPHIGAVIDEAIRTKGVFALEHRVRRVDGTPGWTFSRAIPVLDDDGEIVDWFGAAQDITARRDAEDRYRALFETMGQGYCDLRLLRDEQGRAVDQLYLELNPAYERLIGIPVAEARGRRASEAMPDLEPWWTQAFDRIAKAGAPERIEHEVASIGRWFEVYTYPRDRDHLTVLYEDITDRKRVELALRESEERQAFLLSLSDTLRPLSDPVEIQTAAMKLLAERLDVMRAGYLDVDADGDTMWMAARFERNAPSTPDLVRLSDYGPDLVEAFRAGHTRFVRDASAEAKTDEQRAAYRAIDVQSWIIAPLVKDGRLIAIVGVVEQTPREWTPVEVELVNELAERTWAAVGRARAERALRESEERLRQFGEASQDVLWIRDAETMQWQYLTPSFEAIYGLAREEALTGDNYRNWLDLVVPEDRDHARNMIRRAGEGEHVTFEYRIRRPVDGQVRWLRNTDFPIADAHGKVTMVGGIGHDATDLHEAELRFRVLLEGIPQLVWRAVDGGHWTWASPQWTEFTGQEEADSHELGWLDRVHPDDRDSAMTAWSHAMETGGFNVEYRLCHRDEGYSWFSTRATPVRDDSGTIIEWLGTSTDIDGLRQLQERQRILLAELQHRVRNIMAMIRSVARRTAQGPETVADYIEHFEGRINAMSRTQTLLTRSPGAGVDLQNLVRDELAAQSARPQHYDCRGPDIILSPKAAEVLTLAVHELATNATKYGALSTAGGFVTVGWDQEDRAGVDWLRFEWTELRVTLPPDVGRRKGFGTELVTRRVPYELKGRGSIEFRPTGLHAVIEFPLVPGQSILQTDADMSSDQMTEGWPWPRAS